MQNPIPNTLPRIPGASVLLLALLAVQGCGYTAGSSLDPAYQTIHVATVQNRSREYDLQAPLTNAITRKFITDGRLRVVDPPNADLLLECVILDYQLKGLTFDRDDDVSQFLTVVRAGVRLSDAGTGEVLWEDPGFTGETTYSTGATGASSDRLRGNAGVFLPTVRSFQTKEENQAAAEALEQLATDIFYRCVEPW